MIEFRVEWQDAPGVRDPVLARTWCRLTMDVDGQVVSRAIDHRSDSLRDGIYGSALPLCSWMVENWWCLQHEAYRFHRPWRSHDLAVDVDHRAWVQRHGLRAVGEGGVLPDLMLFRDGDGVVVRWFADKADAAHPYLRFVGDGQASMPVDEVAQGLTDFVVRVLDRIEGMGAPEVEALRRDWAAITTAPPDEREFCIWSARVGLDPYDPDELTEQRENMLRSSVSSLEGELRGDLLDATTVDALPTDAHWIDAAHDVALEFGLSAANEPVLAPVGHRSTAHETGYETGSRICLANDVVLAGVVPPGLQHLDVVVLDERLAEDVALCGSELANGAWCCPPIRVFHRRRTGEMRASTSRFRMICAFREQRFMRRRCVCGGRGWRARRAGGLRSPAPCGRP